MPVIKGNDKLGGIADSRFLGFLGFLRAAAGLKSTADLRLHVLIGCPQDVRVAVQRQSRGRVPLPARLPHSCPRGSRVKGGRRPLLARRSPLEAERRGSCRRRGARPTARQTGTKATHRNPRRTRFLVRFLGVTPCRIWQRTSGLTSANGLVRAGLSDHQHDACASRSQLSPRTVPLTAEGG